MKERAPAFQFYPRQFAGDEAVTAMDLDTVGAHIILMCSAAASPDCCRIPAEERALRNRLRNPNDADWQRIKSQLLGTGAWKLSADSRWWEQDGLRRSFEKQRGFSEAQRQRANKRYCRNDAGKLPDDYRNATGALPESCSSSSTSSSNTPIVPIEGSNVDGPISPEMVASAVMDDLQIAGTSLRVVLDDVCRLAMKAGTPGDDVRSSLVSAWREYEEYKPKLSYTIGAQRFFGEGIWRNSAGWPWKDGQAPKPLAQSRRYAPAEVTA